MIKIGNINAYGIIYKIENLVNGKVYIGQTTKKEGFKGRYGYKGKGIERVYKYHLKRKNDNEGYNYHLLNSIDKYGINNFEVSEVFDVAFSLEELNIKEENWIRFYNSDNKDFGYNIRKGGDNYECSYDSLTRNGNKIICIDDNLIFKSIAEASRYYGITDVEIRKTFNEKHTYCNYENEIPIFRKLDNDLEPQIKLCCICGRHFEKYQRNNKKKYCPSCSNKIKNNFKDSINKKLLSNTYDNTYKNNQLYKNVEYIKNVKLKLKELRTYIKNIPENISNKDIQRLAKDKFGYKVTQIFIKDARNNKQSKFNQINKNVYKDIVIKNKDLSLKQIQNAIYNEIHIKINIKDIKNILKDYYLKH